MEVIHAEEEIADSSDTCNCDDCANNLAAVNVRLLEGSFEANPHQPNSNNKHEHVYPGNVARDRELDKEGPIAQPPDEHDKISNPEDDVEVLPLALHFTCDDQLLTQQILSGDLALSSGVNKSPHMQILPNFKLYLVDSPPAMEEECLFSKEEAPKRVQEISNTSNPAQ